MKISTVSITSGDDFIAAQSPEFRPHLEQLRALIHATAPEAIESISYQVLCFKYHYMLVGIGTNQKYSSLYVMSPGLVKRMKEDLKNVRVSGATLHFGSGEKLPLRLLKKVIGERIKENEYRRQAKTLRPPRPSR
jgi:uncharacterized protein YdhG (YjbR/CyaY superfamily)